MSPAERPAERPEAKAWESVRVYATHRSTEGLSALKTLVGLGEVQQAVGMVQRAFDWRTMEASADEWRKVKAKLLVAIETIDESVQMFDSYRRFVENPNLRMHPRVMFRLIAEKGSADEH